MMAIVTMETIGDGGGNCTITMMGRNKEAVGDDSGWRLRGGGAYHRGWCQLPIIVKDTMQ